MFMVEVFKTNVNSHCHASLLVYRLERVFTGYSVNFDLEDCDRILRIKCASGTVQPLPVIAFLQQHGYVAEVLPDEQPVAPLVHTQRFYGTLHGQV